MQALSYLHYGTLRGSNGEYTLLVSADGAKVQRIGMPWATSYLEGAVLSALPGNWLLLLARLYNDLHNILPPCKRASYKR